MGREKHQGVWKDALHRPTPAIPHLLCGQGTNRKLTGGVQTAQTAQRLASGARARAPPAIFLALQHAASSWGAEAGGPRRCGKRPGERQAPSGDPIGAFVVGPSHDFPKIFPGPSQGAALPRRCPWRCLSCAPGGPSPGSGAKASGRHGCLGQSDPIGDAQRNGRIVEVVAGIVQPRADAVAQHDEGTGSIAEHV